VTSGDAEWWGNPDLQWALAKLGVPERPHWHGEHGLVPIAKRIVALLRGPRPPALQTNGQRNSPANCSECSRRYSDAWKVSLSW
jgi:hypothetical protein